MKKLLCCLLALALVLSLSACGKSAAGKPVAPPANTETQKPTDAPTETAAPAETTTAPLETEELTTEPAETEAPTTEPAETEEPTTEPAETEEPTTEPAETEEPGAPVITDAVCTLPDGKYLVLMHQVDLELMDDRFASRVTELSYLCLEDSEVSSLQAGDLITLPDWDGEYEYEVIGVDSDGILLDSYDRIFHIDREIDPGLAEALNLPDEGEFWSVVTMDDSLKLYLKGEETLVFAPDVEIRNYVSPILDGNSHIPYYTPIDFFELFDENGIDSMPDLELNIEITDGLVNLVELFYRP